MDSCDQARVPILRFEERWKGELRWCISLKHKFSLLPPLKKSDCAQIGMILIDSCTLKGRSPEEYRYDNLNEKIDVYSMGNIFYSLLMDIKVFDKVPAKKVQKNVLGGLRPPLNDAIKQSSNPVDIALVHAMDMCFKQDPKERASAKYVSDYLQTELQNLGIEDSPLEFTLDIDTFRS